MTLRRLGADDGMVLVLSLIVLATLTLLASAVVLSAVTANTGANQQQFRNQALAAAQAGVQAADYRLSQAAQASTGLNVADCFTTASTNPPSGSPVSCPGETESFGTASYTYYVTPLDGSSYPTAPADCTGWPVNGSNVYQFCITSVGTAGGVNRRMQERVAASPPTYPVNGIVSLGPFKSEGEFTLQGNLWGDDKIEMKGDNVVDGTIDYLTAKNPKIDFPCNGSQGCTEVQGTAYPFPTPNPAPYQATDPAQGGSNNDAAVNWGVSGVYNSTTRVINAIGTVGTATNPVQIPAGSYNFCEFDFTNTVYLEITGRPVYIYVDSPARSGSGCASNTGDVTIINTFTVVNPYKDPTAFQIFAYGNPTAGATEPNFEFTNAVDSSGSPLYADIFAPYSAFTAINQMTLTGSLVVGTFDSKNTVTMVGTGGGTSTGWEFAPSAAASCTATPSATGDPDSGCY